MDGLSTFEEFVLRTIAASTATVESLAATLGLDRNVVLDTCVDLLRAGYVVLHRGDAAIEVVESVRDEMGDPLAPTEGWARRLAPAAAPQPTEFDLLQELVSGAVFPSSKGLTGAGEWILAPEDPSIDDVSGLQKPVLLEACARLMRRIADARGPGGSGPLSRRGIRVTDVAVVASGAHAVTSPASIVVEVARGKSVDDDRPYLVVLGPRDVASSVRRRIASKLMTMWDAGVARGRGQFFDRISERLSVAEALESDPKLGALIDPSRSVAQLSAAVQELGAFSPATEGDALERHARLDQLERRATADLDEALALRGEAQIVVGAAEHHRFLHQALGEARHQVVLTGPWVGQLESNKGLQDALMNAVTRGVRVHLLWGVDRSKPFSDGFGPVSQDLVKLLAPNAQRLGGLFVASRPAGVHSKLIACDLSWAIVSSCNFLSSGPDRRELEIGVRVHGPGDAGVSAGTTNFDPATWTPVDQRPTASLALCDAVRWAREVTPDFQLRNSIVDDPALDGRRIAAPSIEIAGDVAPPGDINIWRGTFERRARALEDRVQKLGTIVHVVTDGQHRELFIDALRTAQRRLVVSSRDLGVGLLGQGAFELVAGARARGVEITVFSSRNAEWSDELERRKQDLVAKGVSFETRDVHAKVLVCDDWSIVSSYNFLSFSGYYDDHSRARHELGMRLLGRTFADQLTELLRAAPR